MLSQSQAFRQFTDQRLSDNCSTKHGLLCTTIEIHYWGSLESGK